MKNIHNIFYENKMKNTIICALSKLNVLKNIDCRWEKMCETWERNSKSQHQEICYVNVVQMKKKKLHLHTIAYIHIRMHVCVCINLRTFRVCSFSTKFQIMKTMIFKQLKFSTWSWSLLRFSNETIFLWCNNEVP